MSFIAASLIASAVIAAGTATANAVVQKKQSDEQRQYNRDRQRAIDAKAAQDNAWYRMQYYEDPLRTQSGANMLKTISDYNQRLIDKQRALGYITGATHEQNVATIGQATQNYGNTVAKIKEADDTRKATIGAQWQSALNKQFKTQSAQDQAVHEARQQSYINTINNINNFSQVAQSAVADYLGQKELDKYDPNGNYNKASDEARGLSQTEKAKKFYGKY